MSPRNRQLVVWLALSAALGGCQRVKTPTVVELPPLDTPVALPVEKEIADYEEYTGKIMAVDRVNIMARVDGYLSEILFKPGEMVKKGDLLFVIDRRPYKMALDIAKGQLQQAEARVARLTKDYARVEELIKRNAGTAEEFDKVAGDLVEAKAGVTTAKANVEQAKLNLEFAEVKAPIDGRIGRQMITVGNLVQGATMPSQASVLSELVSVDKVYVFFDVPERDVLRYRRTMGDRPKSESLIADVGLYDEVGYPHKAVVDYMAERLDTGTGTQLFRGVLDNPKKILLAEGMFARARVAFSKPYKALTISERAVVSIQGNKCVYVVNDKNQIEERMVELGRPVGQGLRHIKAGVNQDDRIAVANLQRLMPGAKVNPSVVPMPGPPGATAH